MQVNHFSEIEAEFSQRVRTMVWCNVATTDAHGRPRSRILHPIWEGNVGWIGTHPNTLKSKHLAQNPFISLAYITNVMNPVYVDCKAEWVNDPATRLRIWNLFKDTPEPIGYDPAHDFVAPDSDQWGVLKLTPWRIDIVSFPAPSFEEGTRIWRQEVE